MLTIDEYLAKLNPEQTEHYKRIRKIVFGMVPDAQESISYGIIAFKYKGKHVLYFGGFKNHMSVFPGGPVDMQDKLKDFKVAKGTIQFTAEHPLPDDIIRELIQNRLKQIGS